MKYKPSKKQGNCCYQYWNRKLKSLTNCGVSSNIKAGNGYICYEHAAFTLPNDKTADMVDENNKPILTVADFIDICRGKQIFDEPKLGL